MYDCDHCEKNPYYLGVLGHDGPPQGMWTENLIDEKPLSICPRMTLLKANKDVMREVDTYRTEVFPLWKKGLLLHPGSVGEQPARELAMLREFDLTQDRVQAKWDKIHADDAGADE